MRELVEQGIEIDGQRYDFAGHRRPQTRRFPLRPHPLLEKDRPDHYFQKSWAQ
jgi:hypothetical protein